MKTHPAPTVALLVRRPILVRIPQPCESRLVIRPYVSCAVCLALFPGPGVPVDRDREFFCSRHQPQM
jgi:hypothetical protein